MLLIKFGEEKWVKKLRSGEIFMRPISDYRKLEEEQNEKGQGDKYDGKLHVKQDMNVNMLGVAMKVTGFEFAINGDEKNLIGCFYNIDANRLKLVNEGDNKAYFLFKFTELEKKEFSEWGDTALLINKSSFLERIGEQFKKNNINAIGKKVEYYNIELPYIEGMDKYGQVDIERLLLKDDYFINQNEFRIITDIQEDEGKTIFNIGDISDISETFRIKDIIDDGFRFPIS